MNEQSKDEVRAVVREQYGKVARSTASSCAPGCCGGSNADMSLKLGYSAEELASVWVPAGASIASSRPSRSARAAASSAST